MKSQNEYHTQLIELIKDFDEKTQMDLKNSYHQSLDDLDIDGSSYDVIASTLGTPDEFLFAYMNEMEESLSVTIDKGDKRLSNSYKWMGLFQITAFLFPFLTELGPILAVNTSPSENNEISDFGGIFASVLKLVLLGYMLIIAVVILVYWITSYEILSNRNLANIYYTAFKILIVFLIA